MNEPITATSDAVPDAPRDFIREIVAADLAARRGGHTDAARLLGAARTARGDFVAWPAQRAAVVRLSERLGDVERALAEGGALTPDEAVAWVRRARGERKRPRHGWESLTPTEVEIVRQAAAGLTNPQIAERLGLRYGAVRGLAVAEEAPSPRKANMAVDADAVAAYVARLSGS